MQSAKRRAAKAAAKSSSVAAMYAASQASKAKTASLFKRNPLLRHSLETRTGIGGRVPGTLRNSAHDSARAAKLASIKRALASGR